MVDVVIVGGGPAGLSAGIYLARASRETVIVDKGECTACKIDRLENYLGFPDGISGSVLVQKGRKQAERFGCHIVPCEALAVRQEPDGNFHVETDNISYETRALILATGALYKKPRIDNLARYEGKGVAYCVQCDGFFFKDKPVLVLGSGNLAVKEIIDLVDYTKTITLLTDGGQLEVSGRFQKWLEQNPIPIRTEKVASVLGNDTVPGIQFEDGTSVQGSGVFVALGSSGAVELARGLGATISGQFVDVDRNYRTNIERVYAAGNCMGGHRQIAVAMGSGAEAAINLISELRGIGS